jgi:hypothetical protein
MANYTDPLFHLPGWYWFLEGEKNPEELLNNNEDDENSKEQLVKHILQVCYRVMYFQDFRIIGYHEFVTNCLYATGLGYEPYIKFFYNRQPIVQITQKPISTNHIHITIPLQRLPAQDLQMDILQLNKYFFNINYHVKFLIVVVDIYSRFVWLHPVQVLEVANVTNALLRAFSRPGLARRYFDKIRNTVRFVTIDGGSEFKKEFPQSMKGILPNATVNTSPPKAQTFGRPTLTGPIEAAIRMIRKLLRDYGLNKQTDILGVQNKAQEGISNIILSYNNIKRPVLNNLSPNEVVYKLMVGKSTQVLTDHMKKYRQQQLLKKSNLETKQFPIVQTNHEEYVYRIYLPQGALPKETDFRVSLETYYITEYTSTNVTLQNCEDNSEKKSTWESLVLVKRPSATAPHLDQLKAFYNKTEKQNKYIMAPRDLLEPFAISNTIRNALEGHAVLNARPGRTILQSKRLKKKREEEAY